MVRLLAASRQEECPSGARGTVVVIRYLLPLNPGLGHVDSSRGAIAVVRFVRNRPQRKCAVGKRRARRGQVPQVVAGKRHRCMDRDRLWRLGTVGLTLFSMARTTKSSSGEISVRAESLSSSLASSAVTFRAVSSTVLVRLMYRIDQSSRSPADGRALCADRGRAAFGAGSQT